MYGVLTRTVFYGDAMYSGFNRHYPSTLELVKAHWPALLGQIARNWRLCTALLIERDSLGVLLPAVAILIVALAGCAVLEQPWVRIAWPFQNRPLALSLLCGGLLNLALCCAVWSTHEEARFLLGTWAIGLILGFAVLDQFQVTLPSRRAAVSSDPPPAIRANNCHRQRGSVPMAIIALVTASLSLAADGASFRASWFVYFKEGRTSRREHQARQYRPVCEQLKRDSSQDAVVAGSDPWMVNYLSNRAVVLLPALRPGELPAFLTRYHPAWIVADPRRMPGLTDPGDFGREARQNWTARDWTLRSLVRSPLIENLSTEAGWPRLYRVVQANQPPSAAVPIPGRTPAASARAGRAARPHPL
jgi:hypothetical protein